MGFIIFIIIVCVIVMMFKSLAHQHNSHEDVQRELAAKYTNQEQEKSDDGKFDECGAVLYSGGTTGTTKGIMLSNLNCLSSFTWERGMGWAWKVGA